MRPTLNSSAMGKKLRGGFLLQDTVDDLHCADAAMHGGFAFFEPADIRAYGGGVVADLALINQLFEGLENFVSFEGFHAGIVQLVEVYVVGVQTTQALFAGVTDEVGFEALGAFLVSDARNVVVEVVAELGADDNFVAMFGQGLGKDFFAVALSVGVGGIEEGDAELGCFLEQADAIGFVDFAPPAGGDGPETEADFGEG